MSVNKEKHSKLNLSLSQHKQKPAPVRPNNPSYEFINCVGNRLEIHKRVIQMCGLHLVCACGRRDKTGPARTPGREEGEYMIEIDGMGMSVVRALVKNSFQLEGYLGGSEQYLRFEVAPEDQICIKLCSTSNNKVSFRVVPISSQQKLQRDTKNYVLIKPIQLIEENIRLRALKLSKSMAKSITNVSQPAKKLNFNWNTQEKSLDLSINEAVPHCKPLRDIKTNSVCNINSSFDIRGVEFKKSVEKRQRNSEVSAGKFGKNAVYRNSNHRLNTETQQSKARVTVSKSSKELFGLVASGRSTSIRRPLIPKRLKTENQTEDQCSNSSFYTTKKGPEKDKQVEIPVRSCMKKSVNNTVSKQNRVFQESSAGNSYQKQAQTQSKAANKGMGMSSHSNLDAKKYGKNISQAKIAQVSRPLLKNHKNNQ